MNRQRLLFLLQLLKTHSDMDHKLAIREILSHLEQQGIRADRKTLYSDFKVLEEFGFNVEYDNGYYLCEAPFTLSEIKIITDSLNSLKNLDEKFLVNLKEKLYSFISIYERKQLEKLEYHTIHKDRKFINRLEDCLSAIIGQRSLRIVRKGGKQEEIIPIFLHRQNDYYYLYYHYFRSDKIYHLRFDNINAMYLLDLKDDISIDKNKILEYLNESSRSFHSAQVETISFTISQDSEYLRQRLKDDFPNIIFTKDGFSIKASISEAFFARLVSYGEQIKISDQKVADQYCTYLNRIITHNS